MQTLPEQFTEVETEASTRQIMYRLVLIGADLSACEAIHQILDDEYCLSFCPDLAAWPKFCSEQPHPDLLLFCGVCDEAIIANLRLPFADLPVEQVPSVITLTDNEEAGARCLRAGAVDCFCRMPPQPEIFKVRLNNQLQLKRQKALKENIVKSVNAIIVGLDQSGQIVQFNDYAEKLTGYRREEVLGRDWFALTIEPGQRLHCEMMFRQLLGEQEFCLGRENPMCCKDGSKKMISWHSSLVRDERGLVDGVIFFGQDITYAKILEKRLVQHKKMADLGLLVSGIAHEINNPNNFILFNIPILQDYLESILAIVDDCAADKPTLELFGMPYKEFRDDLFKLMDNMDYGTRRIQSTVACLRNFISPGAAQELGLTDVDALVKMAVALCRSELNKKVKTVSVDIQDGLPLICTSSSALEQILVNLLINAAYAADKKDSWVTVRVRYGEHWQDKLILEVRDNGCGIDPELKGKIFEPFVTSKPVGEGTGLGLFITKNLVDGLGGQLEVEMDSKDESVFRVILPEIKEQSTDYA